MAQLPIIEYPDPLLRTASTIVEHFDASLNRLLGNLADTLHATPGIGLCAPQIGELRQVVVMDLSEDDSSLEEYINPEICSRSGMAIATEACLSLPGISAKVIRSAEIHVRAVDRNGKPFERILDGMHAICLQHEIDHLQGKLFIDRISALRRLPMRTRLTAMQRMNPTTASA